MTTDVLSKPKFDVYRVITEKIIRAIEDGVGEYRMPWHRSDAAVTRPLNATTGKPYQGVNVLALWVESMRVGYVSGYWATYRQWHQLGAQVRKGERGSIIVFYKQADPVPEVEAPEANKLNERPRLFARASWVFNTHQVDGWMPPAPLLHNEVEAIEKVEQFVAATGADIGHGGDRAFYDWMEDRIGMPARESFIGTDTSSPTETYYSVLLHELTHWTGSEKRLARIMCNRFGDEGYAMEELVAELGAAFLCADLGITNEPRSDHARYIAGWLTVLQRDRKALFTAASWAKSAAEYLSNGAAKARTATCLATRGA